MKVPKIAILGSRASYSHSKIWNSRRRCCRPCIDRAACCLQRHSQGSLRPRSDLSVLMPPRVMLWRRQSPRQSSAPVFPPSRDPKASFSTNSPFRYNILANKHTRAEFLCVRTILNQLPLLFCARSSVLLFIHHCRPPFCSSWYPHTFFVSSRLVCARFRVCVCVPLYVFVCLHSERETDRQTR